MNLVIPNSMVTPSYAMGYARSQSESANPGLWDGFVGGFVPSLGMSGKQMIDVSGFNPPGVIDSDGSKIFWGIGDKGVFLQRNNYGESGGEPTAKLISPQSIGNKTTIVWVGEILTTASNQYNSMFFSSSNAYIRLDNTDGLSLAVRLGATKNHTLLSSVYDARSLVFSRNADVVTTYLDGVPQTPVAGHGTTNTDFSDNIYLMSTTGGVNNMALNTTSFLIYDRVLTLAEIQQLASDPLASDPLAAFRRKDQTIYIPSATAGFNRRYYDAFIARSA